MAALVDTNVLVYVFDASSPRQQTIATEVLRRGLVEDSVRLPHQAIVEFVAATTRSRASEPPLLSHSQAYREAEELLGLFPVLYPNEEVLRTALRAAAAYQLSWLDAHLWAYAECYALRELISEDFEHDRLYGTVRAVNPFL